MEEKTPGSKNFSSLKLNDFKNRVIFLDVQGYSNPLSLERHLVQLGAKVDKFLSKDVTALITNRTKDKKPATNLEHQNGMFLSRSQMILNKSKEDNKHAKTSSSNPVERAKKLGIRIFKLNDVLKFISTSEIVKRSTSSESFRLQNLTDCFVKIDDDLKSLKPIYQNLSSMPSVRLTSKGSPFSNELEEIESDDKKSEITKSNLSVSTVNSSKSKSSKQSKKQKKVVKKKESTYCECCNTNFNNLDEHLQSKGHQAYLASAQNFKTLEKTLQELPNCDKLLEESQSKRIKTKGAMKFMQNPQIVSQSGAINNNKNSDNFEKNTIKPNNIIMTERNGELFSSEIRATVIKCSPVKEQKKSGNNNWKGTSENEGTKKQTIKHKNKSSKKLNENLNDSPMTKSKILSSPNETVLKNKKHNKSKQKNILHRHVIEDDSLITAILNNEDSSSSSLWKRPTSSGSNKKNDKKKSAKLKTTNSKSSSIQTSSISSLTKNSPSSINSRKKSTSPKKRIPTKEPVNANNETVELLNNKKSPIVKSKAKSKLKKKTEPKIFSSSSISSSSVGSSSSSSSSSNTSGSSSSSSSDSDSSQSSSSSDSELETPKESKPSLPNKPENNVEPKFPIANNDISAYEKEIIETMFGNDSSSSDDSDSNWSDEGKGGKRNIKKKQMSHRNSNSSNKNASNVKLNISSPRMKREVVQNKSIDSELVRRRELLATQPKKRSRGKNLANYEKHVKKLEDDAKLRDNVVNNKKIVSTHGNGKNLRFDSSDDEQTPKIDMKSLLETIDKDSSPDSPNFLNSPIIPDGVILEDVFDDFGAMHGSSNENTPLQSCSTTPASQSTFLHQQNTPIESDYQAMSTETFCEPSQPQSLPSQTPDYVKTPYSVPPPSISIQEPSTPYHQNHISKNSVLLDDVGLNNQFDTTTSKAFEETMEFFDDFRRKENEILKSNVTSLTLEQQEILNSSLNFLNEVSVGQHHFHNNQHNELQDLEMVLEGLSNNNGVQVNSIPNETFDKNLSPNQNALKQNANSTKLNDTIQVIRNGVTEVFNSESTDISDDEHEFNLSNNESKNSIGKIVKQELQNQEKIRKIDLKTTNVFSKDDPIIDLGKIAVDVGIEEETKDSKDGEKNQQSNNEHFSIAGNQDDNYIKESPITEKSFNGSNHIPLEYSSISTNHSYEIPPPLTIESFCSLAQSSVLTSQLIQTQNCEDYQSNVINRSSEISHFHHQQSMMMSASLPSSQIPLVNHHHQQQMNEIHPNHMHFNIRPSDYMKSLHLSNSLQNMPYFDHNTQTTKANPGTNFNITSSFENSRNILQLPVNPNTNVNVTIGNELNIHSSHDAAISPKEYLNTSNVIIPTNDSLNAYSPVSPGEVSPKNVVIDNVSSESSKTFEKIEKNTNDIEEISSLQNENNKIIKNNPAEIVETLNIPESVPIKKVGLDNIISKIGASKLKQLNDKQKSNNLDNAEEFVNKSLNNDSQSGQNRRKGTTPQRRKSNYEQNLSEVYNFPKYFVPPQPEPPKPKTTSEIHKPFKKRHLQLAEYFETEPSIDITKNDLPNKKKKVDNDRRQTRSSTRLKSVALKKKEQEKEKSAKISQSKTDAEIVNDENQQNEISGTKKVDENDLVKVTITSGSKLKIKRFVKKPKQLEIVKLPLTEELLPPPPKLSIPKQNKINDLYDFDKQSEVIETISLKHVSSSPIHQPEPPGKLSPVQLVPSTILKLKRLDGDRIEVVNSSTAESVTNNGTVREKRKKHKEHKKKKKKRKHSDTNQQNKFEALQIQDGKIGLKIKSVKYNLEKDEVINKDDHMLSNNNATNDTNDSKENNTSKPILLKIKIPKDVNNHESKFLVDGNSECRIWKNTTKRKTHDDDDEDQDFHGGKLKKHKMDYIRSVL